MRNTRKILVALVIVLAMMMSVATLFASAASQPETLYLTPNANWKQSNARFAAYFFGNGETWVSMTDADGDGVYEVKVPTDKVYPNVIFCRMNPNAADNNWNNKWNQTADLTVPTDGPNHYTVKEGTWDSGGGTWSTYGSSCLHTNLSAEATCTTPQTCLDCGDPVVSALGHSFNSSHLCTRCNEQATFTVAGSGAHMGTEWDTGNTANDMTYDAETGTYTKVYEKVSAGSYAFKVVRDHAWGTAYPSADKLYTVADAGSTVTITLKGTTVNVTVELPVVECNHNWSDATCDKPQICSECGQSQGEALGHKFDDGSKCSVCGFAPVYTVAGDNAALFGTEWDPTNTANKMSYDKDSGLWTISYVNSGDETIWPNLKVCLDLGWTKCWGGAAAGQTDDNAWVEVPAGKMLTIAFDSTTEKITFTISDPPHVHSYFYPCDPVCQECYEVSNPDAKHDVVHVEAKAGTDCQSYDGNVEYWCCSYCNTAWLDEAQTQLTNLMNVKVAGAHSFAEGKCSVCDAEDPDYVAPEDPEKETVEYVHNFTESDKESTFFTINGNLASNKGTVEYNGLTLTKCLKIESSTNISFTVTGKTTLTLVFVEETTNIKINGEVVTSDTNVIVVELDAGTHAITKKDTKNLFYISVVTEASGTTPEEPAHENKLVVGETNKIVVTGDTLNAAGAPIEWVEFVVTEKAHYEFTGDTYAFIYNKMDLADFAACVCGFSGKADLEPGTYYICIGGVATGEFNIAVSKTAIVDPDAPITPVAPIVNVSDLATGTTTGDELIAGTGISASAGLSIDSNSKSVDGFEFTLRLKLGGTMKVENGEVKAGIKIVTNGAAKIVLYAISSSSEDVTRTLQIATLNEDGTLNQLEVSAALDDVKNAVKVEFTVDAAGTYYVGSTKSGINLYYIAVEENSEPAHENKLVVGETNKIVVSGNTLNAAGAPIEWVEFVVTEKAHYEFTGDTYAFIYNKMDLADFTACVCGFSGKADLEPGTYYICIGGVATGEFNITVTQSVILPQFVLGENKIVVTGNTLNSAGAPIEWVKFVVTEKAHYEFTGDTYAFIYNKMDLADFAACVCGFSGKADLEPGTYYICIGGVATGEFTITATKTEIAGGEDPVTPELPTLVLGDNTVTIDGSVVNLTGSAITWLEFVVAEDGIYTVSSADLNCYIYSEMNLASADACLCKWSGTAELTAGTYYVCVGKEGVTGEFTVKAEKLGDDVELPAVNTIVVGENKYVLNQALKDKGYEWLYLTVEEDGIYTFSGLSPLLLFIWPDYPNQATVPDTAPFVWNADNLTGAIIDSIEVELVAGTYLIGFRYDGLDAAGNYICEVGEYTYTITRSEKPAHEHEFVEGKCECGEEDPNYVPPVEPELTLIQKIIKAITEFFAKIADFFKNLFVKK